MEIIIIDHPLVSHKLSLLRSSGASSATFRALINEISAFLVYEATRNLKTETIEIETPIAKTRSKTLRKNPRPLVVPILRAGLGMLDSFLTQVPTAEVGFLGMRRDEKTLQPEAYMDRLPDDLAGRQCYVIDPMLATGGSLIDALEFLLARGGVNITMLNILAAPEGIAAIKRFAKQHPEISLRLVIAAKDEKLNERGYIVPGLGDAGDRLYGKID